MLRISSRVKCHRSLMVMGVVVLSVGWACSSYAKETTKISLVAMPFQNVAVKGDAAKFRAMYGIDDGLQSGIKEAGLETKLGKDMHLTFEGRGMPTDYDNAGMLLLTKDHVGFFKVDYNSFRKYYQGTGGYFPFASLSANELGQDLSMDLDHLTIEMGQGTLEDSMLSFLYRRDSKNGDKDSTMWATVKDTTASGVAGTSKKIAPTWIGLDETTDTLALKSKLKLMGITVKGQQSYSFFSGTRKTTEQYLVSPSALGSDSKIRVRVDDDQTKVLSSSLLADRWSVNDKTYISVGYNYSHLRNSQLESWKEYNSNWARTNYSSPRDKDGDTTAVEDKNIWTTQLHSEIASSLVFTTKLKAELSAMNASSQNAIDSTVGAPNGADYTYNAVNMSKSLATAESIGLKYNGIAKTSLYVDYTLAQEKSDRTYWRFAVPDRSDTLFSQTGEHVPEMVATVGARLTPIKTVGITTEYKRKEKTSKLDRININKSTLNNLNKVETYENEFSSRVSWKPVKWLENSLRVKTSGTDYHTQYKDQDSMKTQEIERNLDYDIMFLPSDSLMFDVGYSLQMFKASTPYQASSTAYLPVVTGNVHSLMFSSSYSPLETLSFNNSMSYSRAKNANNNYSTTTGQLLYGSDNVWYDIETGLSWSPMKDVAIEPHYGYYSFRSYRSIETGNFSAHVVAVDVKVKW